MDEHKEYSPTSRPGHAPGVYAARQQFFAAVFWILLPFLVATIAAVGSRVERTSRGIEDIDRVAEIVAAKLYTRHAEQCVVRGDDVQPLIADIVGEQYGEYKGREDEARYRLIVQTVINDLHSLGELGFSESGQTCAVPAFFRKKTAQDIYGNFAVTSLTQAALIFVLPSLFIAAYARAQRELVRHHQRGGRHASHSDEIACHRNTVLLGQRTRFFWRRLAFALLIALGTNYLFAPLGMRASVLGDYTTLHPLIGAKTYPFWAYQAQHAAPIAAGFLGYLLYTLMYFFDRYVKRDLNDRMFVSLINRGISVILLGLILSGMSGESEVVRGLIFVVGVFPKTGIDALGKIAKVSVDRITTDEGAGFEVLAELNLSKQATLRDLGVYDTYDLARTNLQEIAIHFGTSPGVVLRAADRGLLIHTFGVEGASKLEKIPTYTATELVCFARGEDCSAPDGVDALPSGWVEERKAMIASALGVQDVTLQLETLAKDPNVTYLIEKRRRYGQY